MRALAIRRAAQHAPMPLFGPGELPPTRPEVAGWHFDDACLFSDGRNPGHWHKARVIAVAPSLKLIYLRIEGRNGIVDLNPELHTHKLRRPGCQGGAA